MSVGASWVRTRVKHVDNLLRQYPGSSEVMVGNSRMVRDPLGDAKPYERDNVPSELWWTK